MWHLVLTAISVGILLLVQGISFYAGYIRHDEDLIYIKKEIRQIESWMMNEDLEDGEVAKDIAEIKAYQRTILDYLKEERTKKRR